MLNVTTDRHPTIAEYCFKQAGFRKGARVTGFITLWVMTSKMAGHPIGIEEFAELTGQPNRTAYRDLAEFKLLFPKLHNPQPIADEVIAQRTSPSAAGALPTSLILG